jgi:hypothetical protein
MPFSPSQRRLFAVQMMNGEISKAEFNKRMSEGTRKDVDKSGHVKHPKSTKKARG